MKTISVCTVTSSYLERSGSVTRSYHFPNLNVCPNSFYVPYIKVCNIVTIIPSIIYSISTDIKCMNVDRRISVPVIELSITDQSSK